MPKLWLQAGGRFQLHLCEQNYARNWVSNDLAEKRAFVRKFLIVSYFNSQWIDAHRTGRNFRSDTATNGRSCVSQVWPPRSGIFPSTNSTCRRRDAIVLCVYQSKLYTSMDRMNTFGDYYADFIAPKYPIHFLNKIIKKNILYF